MNDNDILLRHGDLVARVSTHGASLRGLWREAADGSRTLIVTEYSGAENKIGGQGDVLIPFPGRVVYGTYTFRGESYQLDKNDKESPGAIHGFVRHKEWDVSGLSKHSVRFETQIAPDDAPGYPFALAVSVTYSLSEAGFSCAFALENTGEKAAPVAAGFHPYFTVGAGTIDDALLTLPFDSYLEFDGLIPTGGVLPVEDSGFDFREARTIGQTVFNTCYRTPNRDAHGVARVRFAAASGDRTVTVWMSDAFDSVVVYSGNPLPEPHRRRSLAIEPMTCGSDAFNHPEWGLRVLEPGESFTGTWGVEG